MTNSPAPNPSSPNPADKSVSHSTCSKSPPVSSAWDQINEPSTASSGGTTPVRGTSKSLWVLIACNVMVFVSSVCVMVLELTASRLIAKHVGNSLYTWTSVIGVVLAGITIGNFIGGWLADRAAPSKVLNWLFLIASILCLSVLWLDGIAADLRRPANMGWPTWIVCIVGMVFFLPSMSLGMISPVVASLAIAHGRRVGTTVGNVYAWGALGSIVGTFLGGFVLIDTLGTRAIVALVAATLAVMGFLSAGSQWAFRAAVVFGWMQFVTWVGLTAAITEAGMKDFATGFAKATTFTKDDIERSSQIRQWGAFGERLGRQLHELGLILGLRDDERGQYHDESNYSYINISQDTENGEQVAVLKLDKLIHSYYVVNNPTALNYDYEQVYAAVTEQAVASWDRTTTVSLDEVRQDVLAARPTVQPEQGRNDGAKALDEAAREVLDGKADDTKPPPSTSDDSAKNSSPTEEAAKENALSQLLSRVEADQKPERDSPPLDDVFAQLPTWISFDRDTRTLSLRGGMTPERRDALLRLHPYSKYWKAVERLGELTSRSDWSDFGSVPLARLPQGVELPESFHERVLFDKHLQTLNAYRRIDASEVQMLLRLGDIDAVVYREAVERLYRQSRRVGTLFLGGGGFIFPRWIESLFPEDPLIHVAELDPAVKAAVQARMGLLPDGQTKVQTTIGDARNFIDDRVRLNAEARKRGQPPVLYDFIYGDAFNDFSVPWHLTTLEFSEKIASLLHEKEGIYLVNLIDIYPRTVFPAASQNGDSSSNKIEGDVPGVLTQTLFDVEDWVGAPAPYEGIEIQSTVDFSGYRLAVRGVMSEPLRDRLLKLGGQHAGFAKAVQTLFEDSRKQRTGRFLGSYVNTITRVFPFVYVFSSETKMPSASRDTFVIVASKRKLDLNDLDLASEHWHGAPFASLETTPKGERQARGQMGEILANAHSMVLTDDFAPVDKLLGAVFDER